MPVVLGIDLGTTSLTALALDAATGELLAVRTVANDSEITLPPDRALGRCEWDVPLLTGLACSCLRVVAESLGERRREVAGLGITGQQHGVLLVDDRLTPLTPIINWQDRRGHDPFPGTDGTFVQRALALAGPDAPRRTGCRLAAGYMAVTLFWLREHGLLPPGARACFLPDYFGALLTDQVPVTDPTLAASSGVLDLASRDWDPALLHALGLPRAFFPDVRPSGSLLGGVTAAQAAQTGLPEGLPVFLGIGDNQASFLGSVADRESTVLVNVGTGGQVTAFGPRAGDETEVETRPYPGEGYLLVSAGLSGGRAYAVLERFYRAVASQLLGSCEAPSLFPAMNCLAAAVPAGADGLTCAPFFTGTRAHPELRASLHGVSAENFTPAHLTRALLEGMARAFRTGYDHIARSLSRPCTRLVGAGNGLRENPLLAQLVSEAFGVPIQVPAHREEAAYGAALLAAVGAGLFPDLAAAGQLLRYQDFKAPGTSP
jgi:sugar (pentulose or hexulose) kinase